MNAHSLKTQTVKREYLVTLTTPNALACLGDKHTFPICAESVSAALRGLAAEFAPCDGRGVYEASVSLADAPNDVLYADAFVAPDAYTFLHSCAPAAAK